MSGQAIFLYASSLAVGVINYAYNIIMARPSFLGPADFSVLAALGSLLYIESIIVTTLTTVTANHVAVLSGRDLQSSSGSFVRHLLKRVANYGLWLALLVIVASPLITRVLHLPSVGPVLFVAVILWLSLLLGVTSGALQGKADFMSLALIFLVGAVARLLVSIPLVSVAHLSVTGAFMANGVSTALALGLSVWMLRIFFHGDSVKNNSSFISAREFFQYMRHTLLAVAGLSLFFAIDVLFARAYLSAIDAGLYGGLSLIGRIVYFGTLPITTIAFPLVARLRASRQPYGWHVLISGGAIVLICLVFVVMCRAIPTVIINHTIGASYLSLGANLWVFALFFAVVSVATWLAQILLALGQTRLLFVPLVCVGLQIIFIMRWHSGPVTIAIDSLVATTVALIVLAGHGLYLMRRSKACG